MLSKLFRRERRLKFIHELYKHLQHPFVSFNLNCLRGNTGSILPVESFGFVVERWLGSKRARAPLVEFHKSQIV